MDYFNTITGALNTFIWTYILIAALIALGIYFSIRLKWVQFRYIGEMFRLLTDKATISADGKRGISSFQAFTVSTASRVGTGNLAGVATAIAGGGPGAVFWMWLIALLGGATSFVESTLAQIYKVKDKDGFRGGPAYYMEKGLNARWMGIIFAIVITFSFGLVFNSVQSNTISIAVNESYGLNRLTIGLILAGLTAVVIFGGIKRIAHVTQILVPVLAILYILLALYILIRNITVLPDMFVLIFESAFGLREVVSGGVGAALMMGIKRGLFSNEAGMGSAPNAAATAAVTHPAKQGLIQTLGVFTDTLIICTSTAFIIILSNQYTGGLDGISLTQAALTHHVGEWAGAFVATAIFLFAFSSIIGNYYYGETNIDFIKYSPVSLFLYRLAVLGMVVFGATVELEVVWGLADLSMGVMAIINLIAITLLAKIAAAALKDYRLQKKEGKDPVFYSDSIPGLENIECWDTMPEEEMKKRQG
ncbi:alanine:cation symporter family protein [Rossellomorea vietnamensis]|uniref:Alanine:cation symporter family protein n=2 Tax=Rossellomorea TaxID=2837508 RepID=A0A5D4KCP5_9BACI|nr:MULTISPECIES: alanine/glycine:cation symporter family protein [Rossellomorea]TYR75177.1 alanine:cation symporter family protein [Rossellomorea vietnamensis]TYS79963.1 alanine:cation symporter family protein [Rossellomorea aquimaris]